VTDEIVSTDGTSQTPKVFSLPISDTPPRFTEYFEFAHQFNGERIEDWEKTREIAREIEKTWWETGSLPEELSLLRAVLLIQVRYARFVEGYPSEADMPYLDALVATIKEKLSNISE